MCKNGKSCLIGSAHGQATQTRVAWWYFFKPKIQIWPFLEGLSVEDVGIFFGHFWSILSPDSMFCGHLVYFMVDLYTILVHFGMLYQEKSGNPGTNAYLRALQAKLEQDFGVAAGQPASVEQDDPGEESLDPGAAKPEVIPQSFQQIKVSLKRCNQCIDFKNIFATKLALFIKNTAP
jgi:hypothetical protein